MTEGFMTPEAEQAITAHEMFLSYVAAGFTEHQTCLIIGTMLAQIGIANRQQEEEQ